MEGDVVLNAEPPVRAGVGALNGLDHAERRAMQRRQGRFAAAAAAAHEWGDEPPAPVPALLLDPSAVA